MYHFIRISLLFLITGVLFSTCEESETPVLDVSSSILTQSFDPEGGTRSVSVKCNQDFTAESSDKSWCNVEVIKNQPIDSLVIRVTENKGAERTTEIAVKTDG
jgi:hypothetical protein